MAKEALIRKKALMEQVSRRPSPTPTASPSHPSPSLKALLLLLLTSLSHASPPPMEQIPDQTNVGTISDFMFKAGVQVCLYPSAYELMSSNLALRPLLWRAGAPL